MFKKKLSQIDGIYFSKIVDQTSQKISNFYNDKPFPNYKNEENLISFLERGNKNLFIKNIKDHIGLGKKILEVGCGTGQVSNYLAAQTNNEIIGLDLGINSLNLAKSFADKNNISNVSFVHGDLFDEIFEKESFDFIYCSGVLHHTDNPQKGFKNLVKLLKPNGYIVIGLYNWYGRLWTALKSKILRFNILKKYGWVFDNKLNEFRSHEGKYQAWYQDQFQHPLESLHTICEVLDWYDEEKIKFVFSLPSTLLEDSIDFDNFNDRGTKFIRIFKQILMLFNHYGKEGGLFILVGKKCM